MPNNKHCPIRQSFKSASDLSSQLHSTATSLNTDQTEQDVSPQARSRLIRTRANFVLDALPNVMILRYQGTVLMLRALRGKNNAAERFGSVGLAQAGKVF